MRRIGRPALGKYPDLDITEFEYKEAATARCASLRTIPKNWSSATYRPTPPGLKAQSGLKRHAGVFHLWALGVGAVISGDFFGWNFGLLSGGFGGLLTALGIMTVLYVCLCFSIAEMSPALPHAGGAYSFARTALGPWCGFITGLAENIEYIFTPAVIVVGIGGYLGDIFHTPPAYAPLWWLLCYVVFVSLNILGVAVSFGVSAAVSICALTVLAVFCVAAIPHFDLHRWALEGGPWLPKGWPGVFASLPFALWVYLGIEQLPLAAEESNDPARSMPKGILSALFTLIVFAFAVITLNTGIAPGAAGIGKSNEPLSLGFRTIFGDGIEAKLLALVAHRALITGAVLGFATALAVQYLPHDSAVAGVLLNMAVFGAVIAYVFQMLSFLLLRVRHASIARPFVSPLGIAGAVAAIVISTITLLALFLNPDYRPGAWGALVWFACGLLYFAFYARKRLIRSPEEEFAIRHAAVPR